MFEVRGITFTWDIVQNIVVTSIIAYLAGGIVSYFLYFLSFSNFASCFSLLCGILGGIAAWKISQYTVDPRGKAVFITGCDTGFGNATAKKLHELGFTVFAGCLQKGDGYEELRSLGVNVLKLDVTSDDSVASAAEQVKNHLRSEGLWGLLNNAGVTGTGEFEWCPPVLYEKCNNVNVYGMIRVTRAFLPLIRKARGRIVNVGSAMGIMCYPKVSVYCVSKHSVEALSDCLRFDMRQWGVNVCIIEPGNYMSGTCISSEKYIEEYSQRLWDALTDTVKRDYGEENFRRELELAKTRITSGDTDISPVVYSMVQSMTQVHPQRRYQPMRLQEKLKLLIYSHFPEVISDNILL